jgi:hypothetical protein
MWVFARVPVSGFVDYRTHGDPRGSRRGLNRQDIQLRYGFSVAPLFGMIIPNEQRWRLALMKKLKC